ncbi:MAG: hypothetical protein ACF8OB_02225 [Phycisphaeraceae bacterium JB051]
MKYIPVLLLLCLYSSGFAQTQTEPMNLLLNPGFEQNDQGKIESWTRYDQDQSVTHVTDALPRGCKSAVKLTIDSVGSKQGALSQKLRGLPENKTLQLSAQLKATRPRIAYLQVKLKASGKEIKRLKTRECTTDWQTVSLTIPTGNADEISVQLRFSQDNKAQGQSLWLTDLKLIDVTEK